MQLTPTSSRSGSASSDQRTSLGMQATIASMFEILQSKIRLGGLACFWRDGFDRCCFCTRLVVPPVPLLKYFLFFFSIPSFSSFACSDLLVNRVVEQRCNPAGGIRLPVSLGRTTAIHAGGVDDSGQEVGLAGGTRKLLRGPDLSRRSLLFLPTLSARKCEFLGERSDQVSRTLMSQIGNFDGQRGTLCTYFWELSHAY